MKQDEKEDKSILIINEKGQLCVIDIQEKDLKEYVFNKIGECSNGSGICLGFNPDFKDDKLGW